MAAADSFEHYRRKYPDGHKSNHTWAGRLETIVRAAPDAVAFIQGERRLTWKEFDLRTNRLANALLSLGIQKEDRVTIMGFNSIEWMESYFAISKIGAVPVNLNPRFVPAELKYLLEDSDSVGLIMEHDYLDAIQRIRPELPGFKHFIVMGGNAPDGMKSYEQLMAQFPADKPRLSWQVRNDDFAFLFYTGGTTGYPKGTVWDGINRVRGLDSIMLTALEPLIKRLPDLPREAYPALLTTLPLPLTEKFLKGRFVRWLIAKTTDSERVDRLMLRIFGTRLNYKLSAGKMKLISVAPLFHGTAYETNFSMIGTNAGTSIYLTQKHPFSPAELWRTVERTRANMIVIVGDAFAIPMVEELEKNDYDIRSLATIISSGVRWSPSVKKRFLKKNPGLLLLDELGSTETSAAFTQISSSQDQDIAMLRIKIKPRGINSSRVINPLTREDAKPGEKGELVFGGFNSLGYWKDPERTQRTFYEMDGKRWFRVGDEGTVDEEGYFNFIGRGSSIINTGGEKVYAEEVEEILMQHEKVADAAVTGLPDPRWGEAVTALIQLKDDADLMPEEIIAYCRDHMAGYKKPKHVLFVDEVPRTATGKLARAELKKKAEEIIGPGGGQTP
ncbi:MAG TPA: AMP-binding protein [bacterium]|nr:AMP-binding protein [bacterium]